MIIIHDKRLPEKYKDALSSKIPAIEWLPVQRSSGVYESISCHADIYFFYLDKKTLIHAPGLEEQILDPLKNVGIDLIAGEKDPHSVYPDTALYNAVRIGDVMFHNLKYTDPSIIDIAGKKGIKMVHINQGYARCSTLVVNDRAIITSDRGIAETARFENIDVLLIEPDSVLLPGEKDGFIGGASGICPDGTVLLLGDIDLHHEADRIKDFFDKHKVDYMDTKGMPLYDAGGLFIL